MRQFAINLRDGRVVLCTSETLANIDYCPIAEDLAMAIENGKVTTSDVIKKIKGRLRADPDSFDEFMKGRQAQNVHRSEITRETIEKFQTTVQPSEVKGEFKLEDVNGEDEETEVEQVVKRGKRGKTAKKPEESVTDTDGDTFATMEA